MTTSISSALIPQEASVSEQSRQELQSRLNGIGGASGKNISPEQKAKKLREACEGFESIFIQKMWQEMRNSIPKSGLMQGKEERFWQDMYDKELAVSMTKAGGIGLADMMYGQLSRSLADASRAAASENPGLAAFTPTAAPLVAPAPQPVAEQPAPVKGSVYDGEAPAVNGAVEESGPAQEPAKDVAAEKARLKEQARLEADMNHIAQQAEKVAAARKSEPKKAAVKRQLPNAGAMDLAYVAGREAGDKLSAGAVRPALKPRNVHKQTVQAPMPSQEQAPAPGTAEALKTAVEMAKAGVRGEAGALPSMAELVAQAKNAGSNAAATVLTNTVENTAVASGESQEPHITRVTYTTNIPQKNQSSRKRDNAIRTLTVDNASVNSKAGRGLAAYHAQQLNSQNAGESAQAGQPITPLTASAAGAAAQASQASGAIPPLRASDI